MDDAFIIMQIGNPQLDAVCDDVFIPAIEAGGLVPRRVDRHNTGDLLKSEIVGFIERSQIIVADVTNERPNCYLEIGYAMGLGKKTNLILTARQDHFHGHPDHRHDGPKIHFDLEGYDILFWDPEDLPAFREELTKRIQRRRAIIAPTQPTAAQLVADAASTPWTSELQSTAEQGLNQLERNAYMEVAASIAPTADADQRVLLDAVEAASVPNFGWPIGVVLGNRDEYRPRPVPDGIVAEIAIGDESHLDRRSYDYWKLFRDGRFYTLLSLFEDERGENVLFFDTRIFRVTEALLFLARLYRRLDASDTDVVSITVRHAGLNGRTLTAANPQRHLFPRTSTADSAEASISVPLITLETEIDHLVGEILQPLFMLFDFFELGDEVLRDVVNDFLAKR